MEKLNTLVHRKFRLWILLLCGSILYFFANVQRVAIPGSIFDELQKSLNVSAACITNLGSAFMYVYALNQLVIGLLVDRFGGCRVIATGALLFCIGSAVFPFSDSLFMLYFSRAIVGLGASAVYLSLVKETARTFTRNFTVMLGLLVLIGYTGGIMANAPFIAGVQIVGWRMMLKIIAAATFLAYLIFVGIKFTLKMPAIQNVPFSFTPFLELLKRRHNRSLFLFSGINFGLYYVLQTVIGKKFLEDFCFMGEVRAAWILSLLGVLSATSSFFAASLSRLLGNRRRLFVRTAGLGCILSFLALLLAIGFDCRTQWIALFFCTLTITANVAPVTISLLRETNLPNVVGVSVSFMNFYAYITVAILGSLTGILMDLFPPVLKDSVHIYGRNSYLVVFTFLFLLSCVVVYNSFRLRETNGENCAETTL